MRKSWTSFNNVLMYISMVAGFIAVIAFSFYGREYWWAVVLLGFIAVLVLHGVWGMLIEMSKNIIKLGSENTSQGEMNNENSTWKCSVCMTENSAVNNFCEKCGTYRNNGVGGKNNE